MEELSILFKVLLAFCAGSPLDHRKRFPDLKVLFFSASDNTNPNVVKLKYLQITIYILSLIALVIVSSVEVKLIKRSTVVYSASQSFSVDF